MQRFQRDIPNTINITYSNYNASSIPQPVHKYPAERERQVNSYLTNDLSRALSNKVFICNRGTLRKGYSHGKIGFFSHSFSATGMKYRTFPCSCALAFTAAHRNFPAICVLCPDFSRHQQHNADDTGRQRAAEANSPRTESPLVAYNTFPSPTLLLGPLRSKPICLTALSCGHDFHGMSMVMHRAF